MTKNFILILSVTTLLFGCATTGHHYTSQAIGLGYIQNIAVLPLENFTSNKGLEDRTRELLITRILGRDLYQVVEKGALYHFLQDEVRSKEKALIDQRSAKKMAREFNIEAYIVGSIDEYTLERNGSYSYPVIAITLRMVDIKTGQVIWQASNNDSGYSTAGRLLGLTSDDTTTVLFRLIDKTLDTLSEG